MAVPGIARQYLAVLTSMETQRSNSDPGSALVSVVPNDSGGVRGSLPLVDRPHPCIAQSVQPAPLNV